jgi:outer membrane protein assembly factor BamB
LKPELHRVPAFRIIVPMLRGFFRASGAFSAVMAILLCATFVQTRLHDPVNSPSLALLIERAQQNPSDLAIKEEIRALDLLARKAYFTSQWQLKMGALLLLIGIAVTLLCRKGIDALSPVVPRPPAKRTGTGWNEPELSRKALIVTGSLFALVALGGTFMLRQEWSSAVRPVKIASAAASSEMEKNWPGFRGWEGIGHAYYTAVPTSWDGTTGAGIRWKAVIPRPGNSSPVVWEDRIFLTGADKDVREVFCFNSNSGSLMWRYLVLVKPEKPQPGMKIDRETGYAAPTPACDGKRVFAIFPTGELVCLNLKGRKVWERHLGTPDNHYGHASSPITRDGLLFVQLDQYDNGRLLALSGATGKTVWEVKRPRLSWSSPICVNTGDRVELVCADNLDVVSYDPATGAVLWRHDCLYGEVGPSPAYAAGKVYAANEYAVAACIRVNDPLEGDSSRILWKWNENLPNTASPVATGSFLFLATSDGMVSCVDADSGKTLWKKEFETGFYASPVIAGDRVFLMDRKGKMHIFAASGIFTSVNEPALGEASVATPALLDGTIIIRGDKNLFCIGGR